MIGMTNAPYSVGRNYSVIAVDSWNTLVSTTSGIDLSYDAIGLILTAEEVSSFDKDRVAIRTSLPNLNDPSETSFLQLGDVILLAGSVGGFKDQTIKLYSNKDQYANIIAAYIYRNTGTTEEPVYSFVYVEAAIRYLTAIPSNARWTPLRKFLFYSSSFDTDELRLGYTKNNSVYSRSVSIFGDISVYRSVNINNGHSVCLYTSEKIQFAFSQYNKYSSIGVIYKPYDKNYRTIFGLSSGTSTSQWTSLTDTQKNYDYINDYSVFYSNPPYSTTNTYTVDVSTLNTNQEYYIKLNSYNNSGTAGGFDIYSFWIK